MCAVRSFLNGHSLSNGIRLQMQAHVRQIDGKALFIHLAYFQDGVSGPVVGSVDKLLRAFPYKLRRPEFVFRESYSVLADLPGALVPLTDVENTVNDGYFFTEYFSNLRSILCLGFNPLFQALYRHQGTGSQLERREIIPMYVLVNRGLGHSQQPRRLGCGYGYRL